MRRIYSISHYLCPPDLALLPFLDAVVASGFVGVGLTERALEEVAPRVLRRELAARGLSVSSVNSAGYFLHADPAAAGRQAQRNAWLVQCAAELDGAPLNVIVGGLGHAGGSLTLAQARRKAGACLGQLGSQAHAVGVPLLFEPIHPIGMWAKGCVHSLRQSLDMIAAMPATRVNLDLFHSWWDEDVEDFLSRDDRPLGLLQICDVAPLGQDDAPRRVPLGEGVLDIEGLLRAALSRTQRPAIEVELFAFQMPARRFDDVLASTVSQLDALDPRLP
ncbi:MAG: sugar phosphate isomerase/epimerase family protein [Lautropia sp.]